MNSITFFYPSVITGGAEFLFIRLSKYLVSRGIEVYYIDYANGFARKQLINTKVRFLDYEDQEITKINFDTNLILPVCHLFKVNKELCVTDKSKLILWFLHPWNIIYLFPQILDHLSSKEPAEIKKIYELSHPGLIEDFATKLRKIYRFRALCFMDGSNFRFNNEFFDLKIAKTKYVPIGIDMPKKESLNDQIVKKGEINIAWLGRICEDKINSIVYLIDCANEYANSHNKKINLHIIGRGSQEFKIKEKEACNNLKIILAGTITNQDLDEYLIYNTDILFAMGTSLLEGAKLKIPTVISPFNNFRRVPNKYEMTYLFNSKNFDIVDEVYAKQDLPRQSFDQILEDVYILNKKEQIGQLCYNHVTDNFSIENSAKFLSLAIKKSSLTYENYKKLLATDLSHNSSIDLKNFDLAFLSQAPESEYADGMVQRINFIDTSFVDQKKIYLWTAKNKRIKLYQFIIALLILPFFRLFNFKERFVKKLTSKKNHFYFYFRRNSIMDLCLVLYILSKSKFIYTHSIYNGKIFLPILSMLYFFGKKTILDVHGVVPEEELLFLNNKKSFKALSIIERKMFRISSIIICVSSRMKDFYLEKYNFAINKTLLNIPIFDKITTSEQPQAKHKLEHSSAITVIYAGGTQKWQNIDLMLTSIPKLPKEFRYIFLLPPRQVEEVIKKATNLNIDLNRIEINYTPKSEIIRYYDKSDLGFILRDDSVVNDVSCPTKMIEYISSGVVPIVLQPNIGDFNNLGYSYLTLENLLNGQIPSEDVMKEIAARNYQIYRKLEMIKIDGIKELKKLMFK